ncbi:MAG: ATP-binding protein [Candidatus Aquicultor sp.]|nr:ATP-binding protein [Candidatus Aquicultor sp.]
MESHFLRFINNLETAEGSAVKKTAVEPPKVLDDDRSAGTEPSDQPNNVARLAIYDSFMAAPRVVELNSKDYDDFINLLATKTYQYSKEIGGNVPYTILREAIENLIHAYFRDIVISIYNNGNTVRISDQGPGIKNKDRACEPGFSTATSDMKQYIKGVGSGLPIIRETISFLGGAIEVEDNLDTGTVITLSVPDKVAAESREPAPVPAEIELNKRQKQVLFLMMEIGSTGPSKIAGELGIGLSTAYRDLIYLEEKSLISSDEQGKRVLTLLGIEYLDDILNQ